MIYVRPVLDLTCNIFVFVRRQLNEFQTLRYILKEGTFSYTNRALEKVIPFHFGTLGWSFIPLLEWICLYFDIKCMDVCKLLEKIYRELGFFTSISECNPK